MSFFQRKEEHPLEAYLEGEFSCSKCHKRVDLEGFTPLEMGRCTHCDSPNFVPQKIGNFWLFYPLGGGGMGAVYKAHHVDYPDFLFAVKILPRDKKDDPDLI